MNDIAKNIASRIRDAVPNGLRLDSTIADDVVAASSFEIEADEIMQHKYGVKLVDITNMMVTKNDAFLYAYEQNMKASEFVSTIASQYLLTQVDDKDKKLAAHFSGENNAKIALAEFAVNTEEFIYTDGYAVSEINDAAVIIAPSLTESGDGWEFQLFSAPFNMDTFIEMSAVEKSITPLKSGVTGDVGDCANHAIKNDIAPRSMGM